MVKYSYDCCSLEKKISLVAADSSMLRTSVITLQNPPHCFSFSLRKVLCCRFQRCMEGLPCKSQEKHHLPAMHEDVHALWKQGLDFNFAFLQQHWEHIVLMLFDKAYRLLIYAQKDTYLCTTNQSVGASHLHWLKLAPHHGQELKSVHVPLLCTGARI